MDTLSKPNPLDPLHDIVLLDGRFSGATTAGDLAKAFDNFREQGPSGHLCVFFHGGLVSQADGLNTAASLIKGYTDSGAYPFFFIWNSGLLTTIRELLQPHHDNPAFVRAANHAVKYVSAKIAAELDTDRSLELHRKATRARKAGPLSLEELEQYAERFDRAWARHTGVQLSCSSGELDRFAKWLTSLEKSAPARRRLFRVKKWKGSKNPLARIIHRFNTGHAHGLYTTVIEELFIAAQVNEFVGEKIWGEMKKFIDDSFAADSMAGGTAFLNHLCEIWRKTPGLRVTLIGHSAGAIYVQRFIEALDARLPASSTHQVEVVLLAAAMTFERMNAGVASLRKRVSALRVFGLSDKTEGSYWEVPGVYNKSLLYIVSSLCESDPDADQPLVGMQRYWAGKPPYLAPDISAITTLIEPVRAVWAPTASDAKPGYQSHAKKHGCVPEDPDTNRSVCFTLRNGF